MNNKNVVLYRKNGNNAQIVTISGGKGGVGKTFFSVNFAIELKNRGYNVLIFDADINLSNVNLLLHIDESNRFEDYLNGNAAIEDVIQKGVVGVDVLYVGEDLDKILKLNDAQLNMLIQGLKELEKKYDFIIIDSQAGINELNLKMLANSDRIIMIANPEITSLVDMYRVIKIASLNKPNIQFEIVVNKASRADSAARIFKKVSETISMFKVKTSVLFLGYILDDSKRVFESIQKRVPFLVLHENSNIAECFKIVANSFLRNKKPRKKISFFASLIGRF